MRPDAIIAASIPIRWLPVSCVTIKLATAPIIIIPSTPRFSTPDFSTISSPIAANTSGVEAIIIP